MIYDFDKKVERSEPKTGKTSTFFFQLNELLFWNSFEKSMYKLDSYMNFLNLGLKKKPIEIQFKACNL